MRKLSEEAPSTWLEFSKLFEPLDESVDFYLFQLPPNLTCHERQTPTASQTKQLSGVVG